MIVEVLKETSRVAGVSTYATVKKVQGISLLTKRRTVPEGGVYTQQTYFELTTIGKLEEGNRVRVVEVKRSRLGATLVQSHYKVCFDKTGQSRMGKYELEKVPVE